MLENQKKVIFIQSSASLHFFIFPVSVIGRVSVPDPHCFRKRDLDPESDPQAGSGSALSQNSGAFEV
jgi:hypothetical protein